MMAAAACLACAAVAFGIVPGHAPQFAQLPLQGVGKATAVGAPAPSPHAARSARPVYRYSVVPGGVADAAELEDIVRQDKVVAMHYAGFDVERARPVTVSAARAVYVSYRKGDRVYWTDRKVVLPVGETLLSDGREEMRARCANRISDLPRGPVEPDAPNPGSLDLLVFEGAEAGLIVRFGAPKAAPPRSPGRPGPHWSLPPGGGIGRPTLPPLHGRTPDTRLLASVTPPPLSGAVTVEPPAPAMPPPTLGNAEPPLPVPTPFVPVPDPGRPGPPLNPPLDPPPEAELPEPATAWLMAAATVALLARRRRR